MSDPNLYATLGSLSRAFTEDANLQAGLRRIAQAGAALLPKCAGASVTIVEQGLPITVAATNETALILDESQYEVDDGPCLTAARQNQTIRIDDAATDQRWPNFVTAAGDVGVWSSLSMPMQIADESYCGGLNLYGLEPKAFSETDEQLAHAFADQAAVMVANTRAYWSAFEITKNLTAAMESREVIEHAKEILMAQHHVDAVALNETLSERGQTHPVPSRDASQP